MDVSVRRETGVLEIESKSLRAVLAVVKHDRDITYSVKYNISGQDSEIIPECILNPCHLIIFRKHGIGNHALNGDGPFSRSFRQPWPLPPRAPRVVVLGPSVIEKRVPILPRGS